MVEVLCSYVLLKYSPTVRSEAGLPCLVVVFRQQGNVDGKGFLEVIALKEWPEEISREHREYLDALIEDWKSKPPSEAATLFKYLSNLTIGPLRSVHTDQCSPSELRKIVSRFLGEDLE